MNKTIKIIVEIALFVICAVLVYAIYNSIMKPVNFNKQKAFRESVAIQRLKDIRTLEVAFKSVNGKYTGDIDSLVQFYNNGKLKITMQIGSSDDSLAMAHTEAVKKAAKRQKLTDADLYEMYKAGDKNLVFAVQSEMPVRDTIFKDRQNFAVDSIRTIPFSGGSPVELEAASRMVSGVSVPLFEARMPYKVLLKGLDNQLRINLDAERRTQNKYEGLQVGSVSNPNNNAGNWE